MNECGSVRRLALRVRYQQNFAFGRSYGLPAILALLNAVLLAKRKWIEEHAGGSLKPDLVLGLVSRCLGFIPCEPQQSRALT